MTDYLLDSTTVGLLMAKVFLLFGVDFALTIYVTTLFDGEFSNIGEESNCHL